MTELYTVQMLARMTGKSERAIYADLARGRWPHVKIGRRVFFKADTIEAFLKAHEVKPFEAPDPSGRRRSAA